MGRKDFGVLVLPEEKYKCSSSPNLATLPWTQGRWCMARTGQEATHGRQEGFLADCCLSPSSHCSWRCGCSTSGLLHVTKYLESCRCRRNQLILACTGTIAVGRRRLSPEPGEMPLSSGLSGCLPLLEAPGLSLCWSLTLEKDSGTLNFPWYGECQAWV